MDDALYKFKDRFECILQWLEDWSRFCSNTSFDKAEWTSEVCSDTPQQEDGVSHGVLMCMFALKIIEGETLGSWDYHNPNKYWMVIGSSLLEGELLMKWIFGNVISKKKKGVH